MRCGLPRTDDPGYLVVLTGYKPRPSVRHDEDNPTDLANTVPSLLVQAGIPSVHDEWIVEDE